MKKFKNNFAYGAAALLFGAMTFSACSSDNEVVNVNPSFDGESVKAQFAINIPHSATPKTRMTVTNTQGNNADFLGMQDIRLIPLTTEATASTTFNQMITLSDINKDVIKQNASSKIYKDVAIATGTKNFLFYGQALRSNNATEAENGFLTATVDGQTSTAGITFALKDVNTDNTTNENSNALLAVLNTVANTNGWSNTTDNGLKKLYTDFTKNSQAGSANSILCTLQALYDALGNFTSGNAATLASSIKTNITSSGTFTVNNGKLSTTNKYPGDLNLPDGAVAVKFTSAGENPGFSYITSSTEATADPIININNITYPASLYYWASTPLWATDTKVDSWPQTTTNWEAENAFPGWGEEVLASTQSVALKNNIDYGVGNLALTVKCASSTLQDKKVTYEDGQTSQRNVNVPTDGFPVTAVLVGNQPNKVGYDFAAVTTTGETNTTTDNTYFTKTIYDSKCNIHAKYNSTELETNYTLVLPSKNMSKQSVRFVIELTNNSTTEFIGHNDQIIPVGGKFYLVGELNVNAASGVTKPEGLEDVFISDYKTTANVTITSLTDAYNVIPDLRATNLQLGLSVDLKWEEGITFDVEIK